MLLQVIPQVYLQYVRELFGGGPSAFQLHFISITKRRFCRHDLNLGLMLHETAYLLGLFARFVVKHLQ